MIIYTSPQYMPILFFFFYRPGTHVSIPAFHIRSLSDVSTPASSTSPVKVVVRFLQHNALCLYCFREMWNDLKHLSQQLLCCVSQGMLLFN